MASSTRKRPLGNIEDVEDGYNDVLIDSIFYAGLIQAQPSKGGVRHRPGKQTSANTAVKIAPSAMAALERIASNRALDSELLSPDLIPSRYKTQLTYMHTAFAEALAAAHKNKSGQPTSFTPIIGVDWDNKQLVWNRPGVPICSAASACVATNLTLSQGPLNAFLLPGQPPSSGSLCLLCTRMHAELLNHSFDIISGTSAASSASALLLPPTNNLVDVPGGYHSWALGVTPQNCRAFDRACSIVGSSGALRVCYSPINSTWWVDQGSLVYSPPQPTDGRNK